MKTLLLKEQTWGRSKHVCRDERFLSLAQIDKLYHELKWNMLIKRAHWAFNWPKYACINLADVWTVWNLSYIFHMHTFKQALLNPLIAFTTNVLRCFECFVLCHKFVHVKAIDIFWSNALVGRLCCALISDPFKFFGNSTDISITAHVTVIWSPVAKISVRVLFCSVCGENSRYGEVALMHLLWQTTVVNSEISNE